MENNVYWLKFFLPSYPNFTDPSSSFIVTIATHIL